jgi:hypothetical protein
LFTGFSPSHTEDFHNSFTLQAAQPGDGNSEGKADQSEQMARDSHCFLHSLSRSCPQALPRIPPATAG